MSATNKTLNYELPIFIDTDKPSWLGDWNGAMTKIDNSMKTVDGVAESGVTMANEALTTAEGAVTTANNALTASGEAKTEATAAKTLANNAYTLAGDAQVNSNIAIADSTKNKNDIKTVNDKLSVNYISLTKVTSGSAHNSDAFVSKYLSKIIYTMETSSLKTMEKEAVKGTHYKIPFSSVPGNVFNLLADTVGDNAHTVSLEYGISEYRTGSNVSWKFTSIILWFDGVNTKLGVWLGNDYATTIEGFSCYGSVTFLPTGKIITPVDMLMSVQ